ncbi:MAG: flagellar basal-body rod protein FlgG, partial [Candidatus Eremiobacteraeota bacterium]|nr:flagellar basal-body rod protein FlgG [Candidatus Eremiobacteraeota bacterium]
ASVVPVGQDAGLGVKVGGTPKVFTQGSLVQTGNALNAAIEGPGFFQITLPDGTIAYTRDGSFTKDQNGTMVTADGYFLSPQITIPANAINVNIGTDGTVTALQQGSNGQPTTLGQITLARFTNEQGLQAFGKNLYLQTAASGAPILSQPGLNGTGVLQGGWLENSNVSVVDEMVQMIVAQRAYEANSKAITTSEQMLSTAIQVKQ